MRKLNKKLLYIAIAIILILICIYIPPINKFLSTAISTLSSSGLTGIINYLREYGAYAAIVSFVLMVLQSVIAPIPAFLITLSNAAIFGWVWGAILSWSSAMVGAALCFYISRILGRDIVEKLTQKGLLHKIDDFFQKYGKHSILIARLLPFISFDIVSYAAGLTGMSFLGFFIATGLGQLPATIIYSYVGDTLSGSIQMVVTGLFILSALTILIYILKKIYEEKNKTN